MKNNQLQLVTFGQAKKLKEMGFDYPTYNYYYTDGRLFNNVQGSFIDWNKLGGVYLSAPEIALVFQWLRNEHKVDVNIFVEDYLKRSYSYSIRYSEYHFFKANIVGYNSYETIEQTAFNKALELSPL